MENFEALPDARLATDVQYYFDYRQPVKSAHVAVANLLVFPTKGSALKLDGMRRPEAALFCICNDPAVLPYAKGKGSLVGVRFAYGAIHRLFALDASKHRGIFAVDPRRHPEMAAMIDRLAEVGDDAEHRFAALTEALLPLVNSRRPPGFAERFMQLVIENGGDVAIAEATTKLGCSQRTLERDCQRRFGRTPKRLARGWRASFTWTLEQRRGERAETMPEFSFADLPHYLRELRQISGLSRSAHRSESSGFDEGEVVRLWADGRRIQGAEELSRWRAEVERAPIGI